jgi:leader peptidase (prepilin peptidase)/N-methyltransferase
MLPGANVGRVSLAFPIAAAAMAAACAWPGLALTDAFGVPAGALPRHWADFRRALRLALLALAAPTAALAFAAAWWVHPRLVACAACWLVICAVPLAVIDIAVRRLPDLLTAAALAGTAIFLLAAASLDGRWPDLARAAAGAAILAGLFAALALARPGSAGLGDAKLGLSVGALAAWLGWGVLVDALVAGFLLAGCYALWLIGTRRASLSGSLAFGPFLLAGCFAAVLLVSAR